MSGVEPYCVSLLVILQELVKLLASVCLLGHEVGLGNLVATLKFEILQRPSSTLKLAVPAILFFIQNICIQMSNTYLPAAVFQVTYQGKTFVVAILSVLMLGRKLQRYKWLGISGLALGVSLVQMSHSSDSKSRGDDGSNASMLLLKGLFYVITAAMCSGFANVYFEKMVKSAEPHGKKPSLWVRNIQLATFTIMLGIPVLMMDSSFDASMPWRGYNWSVLLLGINNSFGGLLVALIVKYGDNILKGFSNAISTVLATLISIPLFGFKTGPTFGFGVVMVIWSTFVYGNMIKLKGEWWDVVACAPPVDTCAADSLPAKLEKGTLATKKIAV